MNKGKLRAALQLLGLGWYVGFCIVAGVLGGRWLDQKIFHTSYLFTLIGLGLGLILAFYGMYKMLMALLEAPSDNNSKET